MIYNCFSCTVSRGTGAYSRCHWARGRPHPGQVNSLCQSPHRETYRDRQPVTLTFTPTGNLESPINLTLWKETQAGTE
ncbi:hypothetical protein Q5P01_008703 [Channa striata]|uniref:Uncharacterized protein n=1 Tax=Channa striata TaxID=64152 RepID=A0AA88SWQ7_CHASR|nr:hypothetical protein Q5P01_008703 [Channa striata]